MIDGDDAKERELNPTAVLEIVQEYRFELQKASNLPDGARELRQRGAVVRLVKRLSPDYQDDMMFLFADTLKRANESLLNVDVGGRFTPYQDLLINIMAGYACAVLRTGNLHMKGRSKSKAAQMVSKWSGLGTSKIGNWTPKFGAVAKAGRDADIYAEDIAQLLKPFRGLETEAQLQCLIERAKLLHES